MGLKFLTMSVVVMKAVALVIPAFPSSFPRKRESTLACGCYIICFGHGSRIKSGMTVEFAGMTAEFAGMTVEIAGMTVEVVP